MALNKVYRDGQIFYASDINNIVSEINEIVNRSSTDIDTKGYKVLSKGSSLSFPSTHTIYEIRYSFDLNGDTIELPENIVLKFIGGSINNGSLILNNNVSILGTDKEVCNNLQILGKTGTIENIRIDNIEFSGSYGTVVNGNRSLTYCLKISANSSQSCKKLEVSNCIIHNYNSGIHLNGDNFFIHDNLFYDNGDNILSEDKTSFLNQIDLNAGYSGERVNKPVNFIIRSNRFLSRYVARNLAIGLLGREDNIIIDGNICTSCIGTDTEVSDRSQFDKVTCIIVGYTSSNFAEQNSAIIVNNVCKGFRWSGIYVQGGLSSSTTSSYNVIISENIVTNHIGWQDIDDPINSGLVGGITVRPNNGTLIRGNIISGCDKGLVVLPTSASNEDNGLSSITISDNMLDDNVLGITSQFPSKDLRIVNNTLNNTRKKGIYLLTGRDFINTAKTIISNNIVNILPLNDSDEAEHLNLFGIELYNWRVNSISIDNNYVEYLGTQCKPKSHGIMLNSFSYASILNITHNTLNNLGKGVGNLSCGADGLTTETGGSYDIDRNDNIFVDYNNFSDCEFGICLRGNSQKFLLVAVGNKFSGCTNNTGDGRSTDWCKIVRIGTRNSDGTFTVDETETTVGNVLYKDNGVNTSSSVPSIFSNGNDVKYWKAGDKVRYNLNSNPNRFPYGRFFKEAICLNDNPSKTLGNCKWALVGSNMPDGLLQHCEAEGNIVYCYSYKKNVVYNGTEWTNLDGTALVAATNLGDELDTPNIE